MKDNSGRAAGFTLVELMLVIAVIAILALVLIPKAAFMKENAFEAGRDTNLRHVHAIITRLVTQYPPDRWWRDGNYNSASLNGRLELELQGGQDEDLADLKDQSKTNFMNPYSKSLVIWQTNNPPPDTYGALVTKRPFIYITRNTTYRWASYPAGGNANLAGSLVVWIDESGATRDPIQLYYVDKNGRKCPESELIYIE